MNKVVHFEVPADDIDRAKKFYQDVFEWQTQDMPEMDYVLAMTVPTDENQMPTEPGAINGGIAKRSGIVKQPSFSMDVEDIDAALKKIVAAGGTVVREKTSVGPMGFIAYFNDTEGNLLSLWQNA